MSHILVVVEAPTGQARPITLLDPSDVTGYNFISMKSPDVVRRPGQPSDALPLTGIITLTFGTPGVGELQILPNVRNVITVWKDVNAAQDATVAPKFRLPSIASLDLLGTHVEFHSVFWEDVEQGAQGDGLLFEVHTGGSAVGITSFARSTFFVEELSDESVSGWSNSTANNGPMLTDGGSFDPSSDFTVAYGNVNESNVVANNVLLTGLTTIVDVTVTDDVAATLIGALGTSGIRPPIGASVEFRNRDTTNHLAIGNGTITATIIATGVVPGAAAFHWDGASWVLDSTNGVAV